MNRLLTLPLMHRPVLRRATAMLFACVAGLALPGLANAQSTSATAQPDAKAILMRMADFMSKLPQFSVEVRDSYDSYQKSGQKIEFS